MINVNLDKLLGSILIYGVDAKTFLQGQLTNDINLLDSEDNTDGMFQYSAYLNTKGRMLASFWVKKISSTIHDGDIYCLIMAKDLVDKIMAKLKMYVLRAKVVIEKSDYSLLFTDNLIAGNNENIGLPNNHFIILSKNYIAGNEQLVSFKNYLINNGIPVIYPETEDQLIPQHVNFDEIGGLNFKKGCYLGQEIVARMHYLGRSKRKMFRFVCDFEVKIGQRVISPKLNNQEVGIIVEVNKREVNYAGLVALQNDCIDSAFLDNENEQQLLVQPIKY